MNNSIFQKRGFALIAIMIAILIIAVIAFGAMNRKGQVEQNKEIKNQAEIDLQKINDNLKKNNQEIQNNLETPQDDIKLDTSTWQTFENEKYGFTIKYPSSASPWLEAESAFPLSVLKQYNEVIISDNAEIKVRVKVKDPSFYSVASIGNTAIEIMSMNLKSYAKRIWELNSERLDPQKESLLEVDFMGYKGYKFSTLNGYVDELGGGTYETKHNYIFIEHKGIKYVFEYFDNNTSKTVLNTFQFKN